MNGEAISQRPSAISPISSQRCSATYSSWARPNTSMPTTNVLRIMVLRSESITSWLEKGNHGETTISTPISMPNQSSHVRCLLKKPKPDIVDLPLKRGIRRRPRSQHYRYRTRPGRLGGVCHPKDVGTSHPVARPACKDLARANCGHRTLLRRTEPLQALACGAQARTDLQRLAEIGNRARLVAKPHLGLATVVPGIGVGRIVLQGLVVVGQTAFGVALEQFDHAAIAPAARVRRRQLDRLAVVGYGTVELLAVAIGIAAVDVGQHVGPELDLHGVIRHRTGHVALAVIGIATVAIGNGKRWIVLDGGAEISDRAVEVALVDPGVAAIVVGQRERRVNADGFVVVGYRTIEIALEGVDAAAVGERTGRGRIEPDRLVEIG